MSSQTLGNRCREAGWNRQAAVLFTFVVAALSLLAISPASSGAAGTGTLKGTITDTGGQPLLNSCVQVFDSGGTEVEKWGTHPPGEYKIDDLAPGDYRLKFSATCSLMTGNNVLDEYYENQPSLALATPVTVAADATATVNAELAPGGSISGNVTDSGSSALRNVCVIAYDANGDAVREARTAADGSYSLVGLQTGDHRVEFDQCGFRNNVLSEFYDDEASLAEATAVSVTAGSDTPDVNAQLATGGTASGKVTDPSGDPVRGVNVRAYDANGEEIGSGARTDNQGEYSIVGLPSGSHRFGFEPNTTMNLLDEFYDDADTLAAATPVNTTVGTDTPNVDVQLAEGGSISGQATGNFNAPSGSICLITVTAYDSNGESVGYDTVTGGGAYSIDRLPTGNYRLQFTGGCAQLSGGGIVTPVGLNLTEFYDDQATLAEATPVAVTAGSDTPDIDAHLGEELFNVSETSGTGSISGVISGGATGGQLVLAGPCMAAYDSTGNRVGGPARANADGEYKIENLATGTYRLELIDCSARISPGCQRTGAAISWCLLPGLPSEFYENERTLADATSVSVTDGVETTGIDAEFALDGGISGTVTDGSGDPLEGICVQAFYRQGSQDVPEGIAAGAAVRTGSTGEYELTGLGADAYRVEFSDCDHPNDPSVVTEDYGDGPVRVQESQTTTGIDVQMTTTSGPALPDPPGPLVKKARIGVLSAKGPARLKSGKAVTYVVKVANSGNTVATGVKLRIKGRGINSTTRIGKLPAGATKTIKAKLRPNKTGKAKLKFKVTSQNAGTQTFTRSLRVRR